MEVCINKFGIKNNNIRKKDNNNAFWHFYGWPRATHPILDDFAKRDFGALSAIFPGFVVVTIDMLFPH